MIRKSFLLSIFILTVGLGAAGCRPVPAPPLPPEVGPNAMQGWGWLTAPMGCLLPLFIGVVVILAAIGLFSLIKEKWPAGRTLLGSSPAPSAKEIVKARYARGEIDRQEYWRLLHDLGEATQSQPPFKEDE